jgi:hypothetical protein
MNEEEEKEFEEERPSQTLSYGSMIHKKQRNVRFENPDYLSDEE